MAEAQKVPADGIPMPITPFPHPEPQRYESYRENFYYHQPFNSPIVLPHFGPDSLAFFDVGSVLPRDQPQEGVTLTKSNVDEKSYLMIQEKDFAIEATIVMMASGESPKENAGTGKVQGNGGDDFNPQVQPKGHGKTNRISYAAKASSKGSETNTEVLNKGITNLDIEDGTYPKRHPSPLIPTVLPVAEQAMTKFAGVQNVEKKVEVATKKTTERRNTTNGSFNREGGQMSQQIPPSTSQTNSQVESGTVKFSYAKALVSNNREKTIQEQPAQRQQPPVLTEQTQPNVEKKQPTVPHYQAAPGKKNKQNKKKSNRKK